MIVKKQKRGFAFRINSSPQFAGKFHLACLGASSCDIARFLVSVSYKLPLYIYYLSLRKFKVRQNFLAQKVVYQGISDTMKLKM